MLDHPHHCKLSTTSTVTTAPFSQHVHLCIIPIDKDFCQGKTSYYLCVGIFKCVHNLSGNLFTVYWQKLFPFYVYFPERETEIIYEARKEISNGKNP